MRENLFSDFDKSRLDNPFSDLKNRMIIGSNWTKKDGPIPGVFASRPPGHRCLWSVQWYASEGMISPDNFMPIESMTSDEIISEAVDLILRRQGDPHISRALVPRVIDYYSGIFPDAGYLMQQISGVLRQLRHSYDEFTCPWSPPTGKEVVYQMYRPGWDQLPEVTEMEVALNA